MGELNHDDSGNRVLDSPKIRWITLVLQFDKIVTGHVKRGLWCGTFYIIGVHFPNVSDEIRGSRTESWRGASKSSDH